MCSIGSLPQVHPSEIVPASLPRHSIRIRDILLNVSFSHSIVGCRQCPVETPVYVGRLRGAAPHIVAHGVCARLGSISHIAVAIVRVPGIVTVVDENRCSTRHGIVRVQARPLLPASLLASWRFDSRWIFVFVRWSLLVLPSLLPSVVYTAWGIPGIPNTCQAALSCGVRLMVRSAPRA